MSIPIRLEKYNPDQVFNLIESHKNDIAIRNDLQSHNIHAAYDKCEGNLDFLKSHIKSSSAPDIPNQNGKYSNKVTYNNFLN